MFRCHHEIFIRRSWYSVLPSLDATISCHIKKTIVALAYHVHANKANHTSDWKKTTVIDREQDRPTKWIKEAVHIRKEGHQAMNRDESSYQLSHAYDRLLDAIADLQMKIS